MSVNTLKSSYLRGCCKLLLVCVFLGQRISADEPGRSQVGFVGGAITSASSDGYLSAWRRRELKLEDHSEEVKVETEQEAEAVALEQRKKAESYVDGEVARTHLLQFAEQDIRNLAERGDLLWGVRLVDTKGNLMQEYWINAFDGRILAALPE